MKCSSQRLRLLVSLALGLFTFGPAFATDVVAPAEVNNLRVSETADGPVLTWDAVTTDVSGAPETVDHYRVYRGALPQFEPGTDTLVASVADLAFTDAGAASQPGPFYYVVAAVDGAGNESTRRASEAATLPVGIFRAFGLAGFVRGSGSPVTETRQFSVLEPNTDYTLVIHNGGMEDQEYELVSSSIITMNGVQVLGPSSFNQNTTVVETPVSLQTDNALSIELRGKPGGTIVAEVLGVDEEPPTIEASVMPLPNAAGWNRTGAVVSFACDDAISGIAECAGPVPVMGECVDQQVSGTAVDLAGNTASTDVRVRVDTIVPSVAAVPSPGPNASGWNNVPVEVTCTASDSCSGLASVSEPVVLSDPGAGQQVDCQAQDVADNHAMSGPATVNIDLAAPTVSITSPADGMVVSMSPVMVEGIVGDDLSGVASVSCNGQMASVSGDTFQCSVGLVAGPNAIQVLAADIAGNGGSASLSVNLVLGSVDDATADPATATTGVPQVVTVTASIPSMSLVAGSVRLERLGAPGAGYSILGALNDAGAGGDAVAGDRVFTGRTTVFESEPGTVSFAVSALFDGNPDRVFSDPVNVDVEGPATGIAVDSPPTGSYVNTSPVTVSGTVGDPAAQVTINGVVAPLSGNEWVATVPLNEGPNTLTAVAANSNGTTSTANIVVTLDTTPPHVSIYTPANGAVTTDATVTVTGLVNDIVVGTVNPQQASVSVNGVSAQVVNRSFTASGVPLALGSNAIVATGVDVAGNGATTSVSVTRQDTTQPTLRVQSGNGQSGAIGTELQDPLVAQLLDGAGLPVAGAPVVFRVKAQDGTLSLGGGPGQGLPAVATNTDAQGLATAHLKLGSRAGAGNNIVEASTTGVPSTAVFTASASHAAPGLIIVDTGSSQQGVIGSSLPLPFVAVVTDPSYNRLEGVPVTFTVRRGGGRFGAGPVLTTTTDSDGRAAATLTLGPDPGANGNLVEATFDGNAGMPAAFTATGLVPGPAESTSITGVVLDNSNNALPGVTMRLFQVNEGGAGNVPQEVVPPVQTDEAGQFTIAPAPVGVFKLMADGGTADRPGDWPTLEYDMVTVAGQENSVGLPIYLPELLSNSRLCVGPTTGGTLTIPQAPGFALTIAPGSATFPGGSRSGCVSVSPVNIDKVPMVPGFGQQPRFIVTIQPVGTHFNPPAAIQIPNVDGLAPRAVTEMYSYDHDLASFVAIGTGTVSDDGSVIRSDPGVGVLKAGWHCGGNPNQTGSAGTCPTCQTCQGSQCGPDNGATPPQASPTDCLREVCQNGSVTSVNDDSEEPEETCQRCQSGQKVDRPDGSVQSDPDSCCFEGEPLDKYGQELGIVFDGPLADMCPQRTQDTMTGGPFGNGLHSVDGCSGGVPPNVQDPMQNLAGIYPYGLLNQAPTAFGVPIGGGATPVPASGVGPQPCNQHDLCYQTCASGGSALFASARAACDNGMMTRMDAVCTAAYPSSCPSSLSVLQCASYFLQRSDCFTYSSLYWDGLRLGGASAFAERQQQYCKCCP